MSKKSRVKRKRRLKWKNIIIALFALIFLVTATISGIKLIGWYIDSSKTKDDIKKIEKVKVKKVKDNDNVELINEQEDSLYWYYVKMNLIDVDFNELLKKNKETVGWIQVGGTNINYPFVQTDNNDYYLAHSYDNTKNSAGWVFMDYRNNKKVYDKNTILYAHGRYDNTMFGSLRNVLTNGWLENKANFIVKLSTPYENTLWQVFSVYKIKTTNDYIRTSFVDEDDFIEFSKMLTNRSAYNFKTNVLDSDKILTLSTCYDDNNKVVLHAKLIKREKK